MEIHLGHGGNTCPSFPQDIIAEHGTKQTTEQCGSDPEACAEDDIGPQGPVHDDADDEWEPKDAREFCSKEQAEHKGAADIEYGRGLPKLPGRDSVVIVDKSGIYRMRIRLCQCPNAAAPDLQYIAMGLFPASTGNPEQPQAKIKTTCTFQVLDDFRIQNLECKTAMKGYWQKLVRITAPNFPASVPVSQLSSLVSFGTEKAPESLPRVLPVDKALAENEIYEMAWLRSQPRHFTRAWPVGSILCRMPTTRNQSAPRLGKGL